MGDPVGHERRRGHVGEMPSELDRQGVLHLGSQGGHAVSDRQRPVREVHAGAHVALGVRAVRTKPHAVVRQDGSDPSHAVSVHLACDIVINDSGQLGGSAQE